MRVNVLLEQETLDKLDELRKAVWVSEGGPAPPARGRMIDRLVADAHAARDARPAKKAKRGRP